MRRTRLSRQLGSAAMAITVCIAMTFTGFAADIKDVPKDHWAYQSVKTLVDRGYLGLYGDGTFQGTKAVDRYTLAVVIAKILKEIETGKVGATPEDVQLLRKLSGEFREELVTVANDLNIFKKSLAEQEKGQKVIREDLAKLTFTQREMKAEVESLISEIVAAADKKIAAVDAKLAETDRKLTARIADGERRVDSLAGEVAKGSEDTEVSLKELAAQMDLADRGLASRIEAQAGKVSVIDEDLSATILRLTTLEPQVGIVRDDLEAAKKDFSRGLDKLELQLDAVRADVSSLQEGLSDLSTQVELKDAGLEDEIVALSSHVLSLEEGLRAERAARLSTDSSLESGLTSLAADLAGHKAQTAKDVDALRKENGLLKVLLGLVAVLGIVIK